MINKEEFDRQINNFMSNFETGYNSSRLDLIYGEIMWVCPTELQKILVELLKRHNQDYLPSVQDIKHMAFRIAPQAIHYESHEKGLRVI